jgi:enamine deaminase RidA (YjgF/YER057c/UK114 family)
MSAVQLVRSSVLSDVAEYAYAAKINVTEVQLIFTAGACPLDADGNTVAVGDLVGQTRQVMSNLRQALSDAGAGLTDVLQTTVYVASSDQPDLVAAWQVVRDTFGEHDVPSTLLGVAALGYTDQLVEVVATAATIGQGNEDRD